MVMSVLMVGRYWTEGLRNSLVYPAVVPGTVVELVPLGLVLGCLHFGTGPLLEVPISVLGILAGAIGGDRPWFECVVGFVTD